MRDAPSSPSHGAHQALLGELFSSKVRAAVLGFLLPRPHLAFSLTDLSRRLGLPISSLQHECYKLQRIGILTARRSGNARLYRVDGDCPLHTALSTLIDRAIGRQACLAGAVEDVAGLELAFLSPAAPSDSDRPPRLVLVGDIPLDALTGAVARVERAIALPAGSLDLAFFQPDDWQVRIAAGNPYALELLAGRSQDLCPAEQAAPAVVADR